MRAHPERATLPVIGQRESQHKWHKTHSLKRAHITKRRIWFKTLVGKGGWGKREEGRDRKWKLVQEPGHYIKGIILSTYSERHHNGTTDGTNKGHHIRSGRPYVQSSQLLYGVENWIRKLVPTNLQVNRVRMNKDFFSASIGSMNTFARRPNSLCRPGTATSVPSPRALHHW